MASLRITDLDGLMSVTSFFELGELESFIDVFALYRCKTCGFASPQLDVLSDHLSLGCSPDSQQPQQEVSQSEPSIAQVQVPETAGTNTSISAEVDVLPQPESLSGEAKIQKVQMLLPQTKALQLMGQPQQLGVEGQPQNCEVQSQPQQLEMQGQPQPFDVLGQQQQHDEVQAQPQQFEVQGQPQHFEVPGQPQQLEMQSQPQQLEVQDQLQQFVVQGGQPQQLEPQVQPQQFEVQGQLQQILQVEGQPMQAEGQDQLERGADWDQMKEIKQEPGIQYEEFCCGFCSETFTEFDTLCSHQMQHIQALQEKRQETPSIRSNRPRRRLRETKNKLVPCPLCPMEFFSGTEELQTHFACHIVGHRGFLCAYCDKPCKSWVKMLDHLNSSHILSRLPQRRMRPEGSLRAPAGSDPKVETQIGPHEVLSQDTDIFSDDSESKVDTWLPSSKDTVPLNQGQKQQVTDRIFTLGKVKRGRGRPRKCPVSVVTKVSETGLVVSDDENIAAEEDVAMETENSGNDVSTLAEKIDVDESVTAQQTDAILQAVETDQGDMGKLFEAVEIAMKKEGKQMQCTTNPELSPTPNQKTIHVSIIHDKTTQKPSRLNADAGGDNERINDCDTDIHLLEGDSNLVLSSGNIMKKKVVKPFVQTYFLYPLENGGYKAEAVKVDAAGAKGKENTGDSSNVKGQEGPTGCSEGCAERDDCEKSHSGEEVKNEELESKTKGINSFCPQCVFTKGSLREIKLHIESHTEGETGFMCTLCSLTTQDLVPFTTWRAFRKHYESLHPEHVAWPDEIKTVPMAKQKVKRPFKCHRCLRIHLRSKEEAKLHEECHVPGNNKILRCPTCLKEYTAWHAMVLHLMDHNDGKSFAWQNLPVYKCDLCGKVKKTKTQLNHHISQGHFREPRPCNHCDKKFINWSSWKRHNDIEHSGGEIFKCDQCSFVAQHSIALKNHKRFHEGKTIKCPECNYTTWNRYSLKTHRKFVHHFNGQRVVCDVCGKTLKTRASLIVHKKRKHQANQKIQCEYCDFVTTEHTYLKAHVMKKHAPKPFQCQLCPYGTMSSDVLQSHMRLHMEQRPYPCQYAGCYFRARDQKALASHTRNSHTDDMMSRRFPCNICGRRFKSITMLKNHMPTHTGEKPHKCSFCEFRGKHRSTVHRHIKACHYLNNTKGNSQQIPVLSEGEAIFIEVAQGKSVEIPMEQVILDPATQQQVTNIVAYENTVQNGVAVGQAQGVELEAGNIPNISMEGDTVVLLHVKSSQVEEVVVETPTHASETEILQHLMELSAANP